MPSADVQILGTGEKAAPLDYVLPSGSELILKAVRADFDGSGAGSAFLPALEIISDAGHSVGVYPTDVAVAAGGSASVSFAPFLRNAPSSSGGLTTQFGLYVSNDQNIAAFATTTMEWVYSAGDHVLDLTDPFNPKPVADGVFFVSCLCTSGTLGWTAGHSLKAEIDLVNSTFPIDGVDYIFPNFLGNMLTANPQALSHLTTTDYMQLLMQNADTGNRVMRAGPMSVVRMA